MISNWMLDEGFGAKWVLYFAPHTMQEDDGR